MEELIRFVVNYEVGIYIVLGVVLIINLRRLLSAWISLRKANFDYSQTVSIAELHPKEKSLLKHIQEFPSVIQSAAVHHSPALIANYTYELVKEFNSFYQNVSILGADTENEKIFRIQLSKTVSNIIKNGFSLLGIQVPERM